ncbi:MAG: hypothetical protein Q7R56_01395 [Nanoarchaeota archaeon]|nr:hypothetical protein [Nanoarchaeota archaeon]
MEPKIKQIPHSTLGMGAMWIPYEEKEITFIHPIEGPGTYEQLGKKITHSKIGTGEIVYDRPTPTGEHTAYLLHGAYCYPELRSTPINDEAFIPIRRALRDRGLWVFQQCLWTKEGVYVVDDSQAKGLTEKLTPDSLEERLQGSTTVDGIRISPDKSVRFASKKTYRINYCTEYDRKSLIKNGFVLASYGKRGAELLDEVSKDIYPTGNTRVCIPGTIRHPSLLPLQTISYVKADWPNGLTLCSSYEGERYAMELSGIRTPRWVSPQWKD